MAKKSKKPSPKPAKKTPAKAAKPAPKPAAKPAPGHFTLQVSSLGDQGDADAFAQKLRAAGYKPQIIRSEVPGKGIFYRVRVGDYATRQAADQARAEYEKKQHANVIVAPW